MATTLRIAAAQYPLSRLDDWAGYVDKVSRWVAEASWAGARLLVFPDYAAMELASLCGGRALAEQCAAMQDLGGDFAALFGTLAARHGVHVLAPGFPEWRGGAWRDVARLFGPEGGCGAQEKLIPGRFEREVWGLAGGGEIRVFDTALGRIGVALGADVAFPLIVRRMVEAGARLILSPVCCESMAAYHRVRLGAQARAVENQCFVVQAPTIGVAPWCVAVDANVGAAAVFAPPDRGLPEDGVVAMGSLDEPQWLFAELDLRLTELARNDGQVLNHRRWPEQLDALRTTVLRLA